MVDIPEKLEKLTRAQLRALIEELVAEKEAGGTTGATAPYKYGDPM